MDFYKLLPKSRVIHILKSMHPNHLKYYEKDNKRFFGKPYRLSNGESGPSEKSDQNKLIASR